MKGKMETTNEFALKAELILRFGTLKKAAQGMGIRGSELTKITKRNLIPYPKERKALEKVLGLELATELLPAEKVGVVTEERSKTNE